MIESARPGTTAVAPDGAASGCTWFSFAGIGEPELELGEETPQELAVRRPEHGPHPRVVRLGDEVELGEPLGARGGEGDVDDAAVELVPGTGDETLGLHPVDVVGQGRAGEVDALGQLAVGQAGGLAQAA